MQFNTNGMAEIQIAVLRDALNSYADYCIENSDNARAINNLELSRMWMSKGMVANDLRKALDK